MIGRYGWTGKIARVDLSRLKWWAEPTDQYGARFLGGIGIGLKIMWDEVPPHVGALDPENRLVCAPGPLCGTLAPASGRLEIVSKSPRTYPQEAVTRSGMGGYWGAELKYAGFDALVIQGRAEEWVNLWIHDGVVEFMDARDYEGMDTYDTQLRLRKELDPCMRAMCIGPAGENLCNCAVILSDTTFASGRSGFGAVMGSKRLKAVAVRGSGKVRVSDPEGLVQVAARARRMAARNPMREWTTRNLSESQRTGFLNKYRRKNTGCFGCPVQCFAFLDFPGGGRAAGHCNSYYYYFKATDFYGESIERDRAVEDGCLLANRLGLDTYEYRRMLDFLDELNRAGNLEPTDELPLDRMGSREFIRALVESMAYRRGIGDILADGCVRAAEHIRGGGPVAARYFPAHGSATHGRPEQVREAPAVALMWALDSRDPFIDHHAYLRLAVTDQIRPQPYSLPPDRARDISRVLFGTEAAIDHATFERKAEAAVYAQNRGSVVNCLVLCDWIYPILSSMANEDWKGDTSLESDLLRVVTGMDLGEEELNHVGARVWNLGRAIMTREGRTRALDTLHESYFEPRDEVPGLPLEEFEEAKTRYYRLRGWDEEKGWPTRPTLVELGLADVADQMPDGP